MKMSREILRFIAKKRTYKIEGLYNSKISLQYRRIFSITLS